MDDFIITVNDLRLIHCTSGQRKWFKALRLDFALFLKEGIRASVLLATGDHLAVQAVTKIRELHENGQIVLTEGQRS